MEKYTIEQRIKEFRYWYHKITLAPNVVTPGFDLDPLWEHIRKVRARIDYRGKSVLDIASFDGLFAFEAESLGAQLVVATDCLYRSFSNFLFCREVLGSKAVPYYNVSPYNLVERLDVFLDENYPGDQTDRRFDIVQHFGLLYHLRDPLYSLSQCRTLLKAGGKLIIETDIVMDRAESFMLFNGIPHTGRIRDNYSVWWAPTKNCLFEMLEGSMFAVDEESYSEFEFLPPAASTGRLSTAERAHMRNEAMKYKIGRAAVIATATEIGKGNEKFEKELCRSYRNPGFDLRRLGWD